MNIQKSAITLTLIALFFAVLFPTAETAYAFNAIIHPVEITRGDPFVVVVSDCENAPKAEFNGQWLAFSPCEQQGCYLALGSAEVSTNAGKHPIKVSDGDLSVSLSISVLEGDFPTQHLTLPADKVILSPEDEARADAEAERMRALWAVLSPKLWEGDFILPLEGGLSTDFGTIRIMNETKQSIHSGLDIRGHYGAPVLAVNSGRVVLNDNLFFGGNTIVIDHGMGLYSVYMHMQETKATLGETVAKSEIIGLVGSTGRSTGPHLHFTIKLSAANVNPKTLASLPIEKAQTSALLKSTAKAQQETTVKSSDPIIR